MLAGLVVPFVLGHWWPARVTTAVFVAVALLVPRRESAPAERAPVVAVEP